MTFKRPLKMPAKAPPAGLPNRPVPLPDPPRVPDMQQNKHIARADQTLETWFHGRREGVLVNGQGYLCPDRRNVRSCPVPDCVVAFDVDPERITETNGYVDKRGGQAAGVRAGSSLGDHRSTGLHGQARQVRRDARRRVLAL